MKANGSESTVLIYDAMISRALYEWFGVGVSGRRGHVAVAWRLHKEKEDGEDTREARG